MDIKHTLLLGSTSQTRQALLRDACIPFECLSQDADESKCDWGLPLRQLVEQIAMYKMEHVFLPSSRDGELGYFLTADTLTQDFNGQIHGKPTDDADARQKIESVRQGARVATAFCLEKKIYKKNAWHTQQRIMGYADATLKFDVPDAWIEIYLSSGHGRGASGGIRIEDFGSLFLKSIFGSYSAVMGLPMYELRQALSDIGFFLH